MEILYNLLVIIIIIYLIESITLLEKNSFSVSYWFDKVKLNFGNKGLLFRNKRIALLNPIFPIRNVWIAETLPFSISPLGISRYTGNEQAGPNETGCFFFEDIESVACEDRKIKINDLEFAVCQSDKYSKRVTQLIEDLVQAGESDRERIISDFLEKSLKYETLKDTSRLFNQKTFLLSVITNAYWLYLFVIMPVLLIQYSYYTYFEPVLYILLGLHSITFIAYLMTYISLFGWTDSRSKLSHFIYLLISPFLLIRSKMSLSGSYFYNFHPLLILFHFAKESHFKLFARNFIVDLKYPVYLETNSEESRKIFMWYRDKLRKYFEQYFSSVDYTSDALLNNFHQTEVSGQYYCPRCLTAFEKDKSSCSDCAGISLISSQPGKESI